MADKPTEKASGIFEFAKNTARNFNVAHPHHDLNFVCMAVGDLAEGLQHMNTGIRATYILLDEVKTLLLRQNSAPPSQFKL
jgi:hypothetical protein